MHTTIVHTHPEKTSYNAALTDQARQSFQTNGHSVTITDLYQSQFDPVERAEHYQPPLNTDQFSPLAEQRHAWTSATVPADIQTQISNLQQADLVIFQFPLWWHGPPAILKGWMDRVFLSGGLYTSRMRYDTGYFKGKKALLSVTTGAPEAAFGPNCRGGDFETLLWPLHYSLHYMGFTILPPFISYGIQGHGYRYEEEQSLTSRLAQNLKNWGAYLDTLDSQTPLHFPGWKNWKDTGEAIEKRHP